MSGIHFILYLVAIGTTIFYGFQWLVMGAFALGVGARGGSGLFIPGFLALLFGLTGTVTFAKARRKAWVHFALATALTLYVVALPITGSGFGWPIVTYGLCALLSALRVDTNALDTDGHEDKASDVTEGTAVGGDD